MRTRRPAQFLRRHFPRRATTAFVLLEVIVSLVILGISIATLMRSFQLSLSAIRKNDVSSQATVLAEQVIQELEVNPQKTKTARGTFEEQGFPAFSWEAKQEEEDVKYRGLKLKNKVDFQPLQHIEVKILYNDKRLKQFSPIAVETYLPPMERFSYRSKFLNELFEEGSRR